MLPWRPSGFAGDLSSLDREEFAAFVSDLWDARGRAPRLEDGVLIDDGTCLLLHHASGWRDPSLPPIGERVDVDGVVTNRRVDAPPEDVRVIDADDLRDMVLYAVDRATREGLFERHFGRPPPATRTTRESGDAPSGAVVGRLGVVTAVLAALIAVAVIAAVTLGGLPAGSDPPASESAFTATPSEPTDVRTAGPSTPSETKGDSPPPPESMLVALTRYGRLRGEAVRSSLVAGARPLVVDFDHADSDGFFLLWITGIDGDRHLIAKGNGSEGVRALVDVAPGRHTLIVLAVGRWDLQVRRSSVPDRTAGGGTGRYGGSVMLSRPVVTYLEAHSPGRPEYAGPVALSGPTNVTFRGLDPNATYTASLVDGGGNVETELRTPSGDSGPAATAVTYRGEAFVRANATGRWIVTFDPHDENAAAADTVESLAARGILPHVRDGNVTPTGHSSG